MSRPLPLTDLAMEIASLRPSGFVDDPLGLSLCDPTIVPILVVRALDLSQIPVSPVGEVRAALLLLVPLLLEPLAVWTLLWLLTESRISRMLFLSFQLSPLLLLLMRRMLALRQPVTRLLVRLSQNSSP